MYVLSHIYVCIETGGERKWNKNKKHFNEATTAPMFIGG